ncbi:MAG: phosphate ABC transporter substrate-binding/OmpA family protein, partial [Pseudomonadota bacterium]
GWKATLLGSVAAVSLTSAVMAAQVTLQTTDGSLSITGELLEFDGTIYRMQTLIGTLEIDSATVVCSGDACPDIERTTQFAIAVGDGVDNTLLANLIEEYAFQEELVAEQTISEGQTALELMREGEDVLVSVQVERSDTPEAFSKLLGGEAAVALTTRPVGATEIDAFAQAGFANPSLPEQEKVIALDALVPVTAPGNRMRTVTLQQLALMAAGTITNWSQLGLDPAPLRVVLPAEGTASFEVLRALVLDPSRVTVAPSIERVAGDEDLSDTVARDPNAIGVVSLSSQRNAQIVPVRRICGAIARPSSFTIKAEEYPLTRRVFMYLTGQPVPSRITDLVSFAGSTAARDAIQSVGFIDQSIVSTDFDEQGVRLASALLSAPDNPTLRALQNFSREFIDAERLSTTFRFTTGSSNLDNKALGDIDRMAEYLTRGEAADLDILVVGFTDSFGRQDLNVLLGQSRAEQVEQALIRAAGGGIAPNRITAQSFGPLAPVGCNETAAGRAINRRVEIWLRNRG